MLSIKPKTLSRIASVQGIYYHTSAKLPIERILSDLEKFYDAEIIDQDSQTFGLKVNKIYLHQLLHATLLNIENVDSAISNNLIKTRDLQNLNLTLLSVLRAGVTELYYFPDTPFKVVINEFTNIASMMLVPNEVDFVNSLLQKVHDQNNQTKPQDDPFIQR